MFLDAFGHNFNTFWRLCFADTLDGVFCCFCMPKSLLKWSKNHPVELPLVPKTSKIHNFSRKGRFGSVLGRLVIFGRPIWSRFRPIYALFSACFACFSQIFKHFTVFRRIGVGKGGAQFSRSHSLAFKLFFSTKTSDWHGADLLCNLDKIAWDCEAAEGEQIRIMETVWGRRQRL